MNVREFEKSIQRSFKAFLDMDLTGWGKFPKKGSLSPNSEFNKTALNASSNYEDVYRAALGLNYLNFSLEDHAFFQFSIREKRDSFVLRYSYYPNPFFIDEEARALINEALLDEPDLIDQVLNEAPIFIDKPPIRYDYDPECHSPCDHPAGHLHVGGYASNRWPVQRILSPETFCLFIAKQYYRSFWVSYGQENGAEGRFDNSLDHRYARSVSNCQLIDSDLFTERESEHLFLS